MQRLLALLDLLDDMLLGAPRALAEALRVRPLAAVAIVFLIGILIAECAPFATLAFAVIAFLAAAAWAALFALKHAWAPGPLMVAICCAGALLHRAQTRVPADDVSGFVGRWVQIEARVCEQPTSAREYIRFVADVKSVRVDRLAMTASGRLMVTAAATDAPQFGDLVRLEGELSEAGEAHNPGEFDYRAHLARRDIRAQCFATRVARVGGLEGWGTSLSSLVLTARRAILRRLEQAMPGQQPALHARLLASLVYGIDAAPLPPESVEPFRQTGTVHVLVVSGAQVSLLVIGLFALVGASRRRFKPWQAILAAIVVFAFAALVGFGPSVNRAAGMAVLTLLAWSIHRRPDVCTGLAFAALVLCLLDTNTLFEVGAQMSFAACFGLVHFARREPGDAGSGWWRRLLRPGLLGTLGAWVMVAPLLTYHFHTLPLTGAVANLAVVPLATLLLGVGLLATGLVFVSAPLAVGVSYVGRALILAMLRCVDLGAELPWACIDQFYLPWTVCVAWYAMALLAVHALRSPRELIGRERLIVLAAAVVAVGACLVGYRATTRPLTLTVLAVGDGSSALLQSPSGMNVLIDAGRHSRRPPEDLAERVILPALARRFATPLHVVLATHAHADHINALPHVFSQTRPELLLEPCLPCDSEEYDGLLHVCESLEIPRRRVRRGGRLRLGRGAQLDFLAPFDPPLAVGESFLNNNSAVALLTYGKCRMLLCADIEAEAEAAMLANRDALRADVLLAPHHGSDTSNTPGFIAAVRPKVVVFPAGRSKRLGNPDPTVVARYKAAGARVFRTDTQGSVTVRTNGRTVWVRAHLGGDEYELPLE
jgi:competence protein ComEC